MAVFGAFILYLVGWMDYPLVHCLILGALVAVTGVCGDLFESVWKRRYGFKDSGNCIPGHGGMLDRFDSSLFAIPSAFVYLALSGLL
jgi:phosphatidate cytidylyltransferase